MKPAMTLLFIFSISVASAQSVDEKKAIKQGNEAYKKGEYDKASGSYQEVIQKNPDNATAQFNNGNALYKSDKKEESVKAYDNAISLFGTAAEKSNAYYNKGVVLLFEKKLPECIEAYKQALKLDPSNEDARQNLQKALQQQKQQQQQQQQQKQDQKQEKKKQDQQQNQDKQKEPKPQPSKLTRKDAEEKLKALLQQEKTCRINYIRLIRLLQQNLKRTGNTALLIYEFACFSTKV
jgi:tetratricopeptide (TPR) repeat protein